MLEQNNLQVYLAESGEVIIASVVYQWLTKSFDIQHVTISPDDLMKLATCLNDLAAELS